MSVFISIITATYNSEKFILQTYQSILEQDCESWEWLVTDDCSQDSTWKILLDISKNDCRVKVKKNIINSGAAISRNKSLEDAQGRFIAFLDSDDIWVKGKLKAQTEFMLNSECYFSFTAYSLINENGESLDKHIDIDSMAVVSYKDMLLKKSTLGCSTVILDREFFGKIQMPLLRTGQDYALWLSLLKKTDAYFLKMTLTKYRIVSNSISRNKFKKALRQWQIYREIERINLFKSLWYFCNYAYRAVSR
ncbi:glycosyltransferase family 2 protein [Pectobacterium brasiliense]|uniref:glycosyltransferase family 2 protein n=1 Tax=Pectobacterium brasiliense TaxID=180957 RepID=UPI00227CBE0B|nr:glycosyltransferase family 2 protein [Pectobacterium brasiliense]WGL29291.1 glycosyltransferase family 2 protein [Pectobacterium brasiliense]